MTRNGVTGTATALYGLLVLLTACRSDPTVPRSVPIADVDVTVDSAVYHLKPFFASYHIYVKTTISNHSDHDIFIAQDCADGRHLRRADSADKRELLLGQYGCEALAVTASSIQASTPLRIPAGTVYTDTWDAFGSNSSETRPPITIDDNTGKLVMTYVLTDSTGTARTTIASNTFDVVPPVFQPGDTLRVTSGIGLRVRNDSVLLSREHEVSNALVNVRVYNRRNDPISVNPCAWKMQQKEGASWAVVDAVSCAGPIDDQIIEPGDSSDFATRIDDAPQLQALYNREPLSTGTYDVLLEISFAGERHLIESNTFALFVGGSFVLPSITGVITPVAGDSLSALVEADPTDRGDGDRMTPKATIVNLFSLLDRSKARQGCVASVWYDELIPIAATYPVSATAKSAAIVRCP